MAADLGGSQISALLESVPGIAAVLRSPVADAIVNMIRAGAGVQAFDYSDAEELVQYAVRRGLISAAEGEAVLQDAKGAAKGGRKRAGKAKPAPRKPAVKKPAVKKPTAKKLAKKTVTARAVQKTAAKPKAAKPKAAKKAAKSKAAKKATGRPRPTKRR